MNKQEEKITDAIGKENLYEELKPIAGSNTRARVYLRNEVDRINTEVLTRSFHNEDSKLSYRDSEIDKLRNGFRGVVSAMVADQRRIEADAAQKVYRMESQLEKDEFEKLTDREVQHELYNLLSEIRDALTSNPEAKAKSRKPKKEVRSSDPLSDAKGKGLFTNQVKDIKARIKNGTNYH